MFGRTPVELAEPDSGGSNIPANGTVLPGIAAGQVRSILLPLRCPKGLRETGAGMDQRMGEQVEDESQHQRELQASAHPLVF